MKLILHLFCLIIAVSADNMTEYKEGIVSLIQDRIKVMPTANQETILKIVTKSIVAMEYCDERKEEIGDYFDCISLQFADCNRELNKFM